MLPAHYFVFHIRRYFVQLFSASTGRWDILSKEIMKKGGSLKLKRLRRTRWAERADATKALYSNLNTVETVLEEISSK